MRAEEKSRRSRIGSIRTAMDIPYTIFPPACTKLTTIILTSNLYPCPSLSKHQSNIGPSLWALRTSALGVAQKSKQQQGHGYQQGWKEVRAYVWRPASCIHEAIRRPASIAAGLKKVRCKYPSESLTWTLNTGHERPQKAVGLLGFHENLTPYLLLRAEQILYKATLAFI